MNVKQGNYNLGWCNNNNNCREVAEGTCGYDNRYTDAQCAKWSVSNGDNCGSYNRYAYVYLMCGYSWNPGSFGM